MQSKKVLKHGRVHLRILGNVTELVAPEVLTALTSGLLTQSISESAQCILICRVKEDGATTFP
jgi:hypothetical protein